MNTLSIFSSIDYDRSADADADADAVRRHAFVCAGH